MFEEWLLDLHMQFVDVWKYFLPALWLASPRPEVGWNRTGSSEDFPACGRSSALAAQQSHCSKKTVKRFFLLFTFGELINLSIYCEERAPTFRLVYSILNMRFFTTVFFLRVAVVTGRCACAAVQKISYSTFQN